MKVDLPNSTSDSEKYKFRGENSDLTSINRGRKKTGITKQKLLSPAISTSRESLMSEWKTREAEKVNMKTKLQGGEAEQARRQERGQSKETRWRERQKAAWVASFEDEQCPLVTRAPVLLRLCCQIKRGWNWTMERRNGSGGESGRQEVVSRPGTLLWPHQSTHTQTHTRRRAPPHTHRGVRPSPPPRR